MQLELKTDYRIPSCIPACETGHMLDWRQQYEEMYTTIKKTEVMMDMYYYREEAKVEMTFQDITMDGSKVYRMAAKDRKKKTRASKTGKRQK